MTNKPTRLIHRSLQLSLALLLMLVTQLAAAHQIKAAITTVLFNTHTQNIEVMHRFNLHDAEHAVKALFDKKADILGDSATQQAFADYVAERFALLNANGEPLTLNSVGYEIEGKFFWVYQETAQPPELHGLTVRHDALRDLWPAQINTLNVEGHGDIKTLTFRDNVELLNVEFDAQPN